MRATRNVTTLGLGIVLVTAGCGGGGSPPAPPAGPVPLLKIAKLLIEHNATDEDTGFQGFVDGDPWNQLRLTGPTGASILFVQPLGGLQDFGLTELFFETSEPENAVVPIPTVLARLNAGPYSYTGDMVGGPDSVISTPFTHKIPEGALLLTPTDGSTVAGLDDIVVSWEAVADDLDGVPVNIVGYQVIVEQDTPVQFPGGFARPLLSVFLPETATSLTIPAGFLEDDACYKYEVLAIEESGNQTLTSAAFTTGLGCVEDTTPEDPTPRLKVAKLLIEHNATDEDTGFQGFVDGDPWNSLTVRGPDSTIHLTARPEGTLVNFGLTELFFETSEPENAVVPIPTVLARLPAGTYTFTGDMVGGGQTSMTATLTHRIPAGPVLLSPADGATNVDASNVVVSWSPVTTDIDGAPIQIVGYQVIVEEDVEPQFPQGFARSHFSIHLPATATSVTIPLEFMEGGADYKYEVLAIEVGGNQTLASAEFSTQ